MADEGVGDVLALFEQAPARVVDATFTSEGEEFEVTLKLFSRSELERVRKSCMRKVFHRDARQVLDEVDDKKLRDYLAHQVLTGWTGLTGRKLFHFGRRAISLNGQADALSKELPYDPKVADVLLQHAVCVRDSGTIGFGDWLWEQAMGAAEQFDQITEEKKISSATTSAAISST